MAKFETAEAITGRNEGGYANNAADTGGETYAGITRNHWPNWAGWKIIDQIKNAYGRSASVINRQAKLNPTLQKMISDFYKINFWNVNKLDMFTDQQLANSVYDFAVNSGNDRSAKFLQQAANDTGLVNLVVDGDIGNKTIAAINALSGLNVYTNFNRRREVFYRSIAKGSQAQFLKSWLSRLKPYKNC